MLWAGAISAAEIKVIGGSAVTPAMEVLISRFERATGHQVKADLDGAIGAMAKRIDEGEAADVVIVSRPQIAALEEKGRVVRGSAKDIGKTSVALFVRSGAPKPDVGSVESFKRAMLAAKSIGYNDPAAGAPVGLYLLGLFERMGIAPEMARKTVVFKQRSERFAPIARGEVEIGFNQVSEIIVAPGVELAGPLPEAIQNYTFFAAAVVTAGNNHDAAAQFVSFLASPEAAAVMKAAGLQ
jgi:molybdate transport system substrate-binding protein